MHIAKETLWSRDRGICFSFTIVNGKGGGGETAVVNNRMKVYKQKTNSNDTIFLQHASVRDNMKI